LQTQRKKWKVALIRMLGNGFWEWALNETGLSPCPTADLVLEVLKLRDPLPRVLEGVMNNYDDIYQTEKSSLTKCEYDTTP
jgi:hypothetical protein